MPWRIEVRVPVPDGKGGYVKEWRDVRPTNGAPYEYDTREEAAKMARIC